MYSAPFQCRRARYCEPYCIAGTRPVQAASKIVKEVDLLSFEQLSLRFKDWSNSAICIEHQTPIGAGFESDGEEVSTNVFFSLAQRRVSLGKYCYEPILIR